MAKAHVYRFKLRGQPWMAYIGARNKIEATEALSSRFGNRLCEVRLHPVNGRHLRAPRGLINAAMNRRADRT